MDYLAAAKAALGVLPTQERLVIERFFDETGDMHLVIHSPFGSRASTAPGGWRCASASAASSTSSCRRRPTEDAIVLSLGPTHSFPLEEASRYLTPRPCGAC